MDSSLLIVLGLAVLLVVVAVVVLLFRRPSGTPTASPKVDAKQRTEAPGLRQRLEKTRTALSSSLGGLFSADSLPSDVWEEIEDALILADVGPGAASEIVASLKSDRPTTGAEAREALRDELVAWLGDRDRSLNTARTPSVFVVVGVNGTGKTTSIAKIANEFVGSGRSVVLGAADTFRAAADAQLREWGSRVGVRVVSGKEGADPASVAHDALTTARAEGASVVIIDTAGRLHSQQNLMDELGKVIRILTREAGGIDEVLLVLDGTTGQNGIAQAKAFTEAVGVTGAVLTKLDGTSRGGIALAVERELGVPVKFIGVGEGMHDLIPFVPSEFVEALVAP